MGGGDGQVSMGKIWDATGCPQQDFVFWEISKHKVAPYPPRNDNDWKWYSQISLFHCRKWRPDPGEYDFLPPWLGAKNWEGSSFTPVPLQGGLHSPQGNAHLLLYKVPDPTIVRAHFVNLPNPSSQSLTPCRGPNLYIKGNKKREENLGTLTIASPSAITPNTPYLL